MNIHASCTSLVVNKLDMVRVSYTSSKYFCSMDYNLIDLKGNLTIKKGNLLRLSKRRTSNPTIQIKKRNSVIDSVFLDLTVAFLQLLNCNESSQLMLIPPLHIVKPMVGGKGEGKSFESAIFSNIQLEPISYEVTSKKANLIKVRFVRK